MIQVEALTKVLHGEHTKAIQLDLQLSHKYIVLSDQHKGAGDRADEFRPCEAAYRQALHHYLSHGFTLILLGDVEELWEQGFRAVERTYEDVLKLEGAFPADRYYRIWGNHDDYWSDPRQVENKLRPYMPASDVYEGLRFEVISNGFQIGQLFMVHGHQGTLLSDKFGWLGPFGLRFYRWMQRIFGIGGNTPAKDACLRDEHETLMYEWAVKQHDFILLTGHTHRPVWSSRTHLQKLQQELESVKGELPSPERDKRIADLEAAIAKCKVKSPPCDETVKTKPAYFNAGACSFDDGDITGIELEDGMLRLVKWESGGNGRTVFEEDSLKDIYARL